MVSVGEVIIFGGDAKESACRVERVAEDSESFAVMEYANTLRIGRPYNLTVKRKDGYLTGEGIVVKVEKFESDGDERSDTFKNKLVYFVSITKPLKRIQKREFVRHDCYLPIVMYDHEEAKPHKGHILNISAGGMKVLCSHRFMSNSLIHLEFALGQKKMELEASILEILPTDPKTSVYAFSMRLQFVGVGNKNEKEIMTYIFREYRKIRNKVEEKK